MKVEEQEYKGYTIEIHQDEDPLNPRTEYDNAGTMIGFHRRYSIGDKHNMDVEEAKEYVEHPDVISLPLYLYDHSGVSISTRSFNGRAHHAEWDSGPRGWITITKEKALYEWGGKRLSKQVCEKAVACLESEVKTYDQFLRGEVYGFVITDPDGDEVDSCWGFYGDPEESMVPECKSHIDRISNKKERFEENIAPILM